MSSRRRRRRRSGSPAKADAGQAPAPSKPSQQSKKSKARKHPKGQQRKGLGRGFWTYFVIMMVVMIPLNLLCLSNVGDQAGRTAEVQPPQILNTLDDAPASYSTDPPTSGPHVQELAPPGFHSNTIPDPVQVANLDRGYAIVHFNPTAGARLEGQMRRLAREFEGQDVIVQPDESLASPVVLTAWGRIDELEEFDKDRIYDFVRRVGGLNHRALGDLAPAAGAR